MFKHNRTDTTLDLSESSRKVAVGLKRDPTGAFAIATVRFGAYGSFFASARATVRVHSHRDVASRRATATTRRDATWRGTRAIVTRRVDDVSTTLERETSDDHRVVETSDLLRHSRDLGHVVVRDDARATRADARTTRPRMNSNVSFVSSGCRGERRGDERSRR